MLCEHCQEREATVHVGTVSWPSGELIKHVCESCYPAVEEQHARSNAAQPSAPMPDNIEDITAGEYLEFSARAGANGADKPVFQRICQELERLPATRERLGLELLRMAWQSFEQGNKPYELIGLGGCFGNSTQTRKPPEFLELLEKLTVRSFEALVRSSNPPEAHPFGFGLTLAVSALRRADPQRATALLANLKDAFGKETRERRRLIFDYIQQRIAKADLDLERRRQKPT